MFIFTLILLKLHLVARYTLIYLITILYSVWHLIFSGFSELQIMLFSYWRKKKSPLDSKEMKPVNPKGNQYWIFIGRTDAEAETPILWPPDAKRWLIWEDPDAGKDWGQVEKGMTEDEMVGWHHRLNGHEFGWTLGVGDGQGGLACCSSWGCKESDTTEPMTWPDLTGGNTWQQIEHYESRDLCRYYNKKEKGKGKWKKT